jgi:membrane protease YdiL (CAAX protease family)
LALKSAELAMLLPLTALFRRFIDRRRWIGLGFYRGRGWHHDILLGLGLGGAQMLAVLGIEWAGGWVSVGVPDLAALIDGLQVGVGAAGLFLVGAVGEELMFRGYLQANLCEGMGSVPALVVTCLLFGVFHALNPHFSWVALLNVALAGLSLGYGRLVTGALWLPMAYHLSWNLTQGALLSLPVSGVRYGGLLEVTDLGIAPLLTGGAFGPEGGWISTWVLLSSFPVLWAWGRWKSTDRPGR